ASGAAAGMHRDFKADPTAAPLSPCLRLIVVLPSRFSAEGGAEPAGRLAMGLSCVTPSDPAGWHRACSSCHRPRLWAVGAVRATDAREHRPPEATANLVRIIRMDPSS